MPNEKDEQEKLKVVDRRRFTSEGALREEAGSQTDDRAESKPAHSSPATPAPEPDKRPPTAPPASPPVARTAFEGLLMSLSTTAMLQMGLVEDPEQGRFPADPEAARHTIDLLGVLEEKTRGNLAPEEQQLLEQLLSELRLLFVRVSGGEIPNISPQPGE